MALKKFKIKDGASPVQHFPNNIGRVDLSEQTDAFITEHLEILVDVVEEVKQKTTEDKISDKK